jgi:hypothetical protein
MVKDFRDIKERIKGLSMIYLIVGIILIIYPTWRPLNTTELFLDLRSVAAIILILFASLDGTMLEQIHLPIIVIMLARIGKRNRGIDFEFLFSQKKANYTMCFYCFKMVSRYFNVQIYQ